MKVALIGATGFVGSAITKELLQRGHKVTAIVRNPEKISPVKDLSTVKADALDEVQVREAVTGHEAVISAYNAGWTNPNLYNEFLTGSKAIQAGVKAAGITRLIVVGGAGSLYVDGGVQLVDTNSFPEEWKPGALGARDYLDELKKEQVLAWTFLSPAIEMHPGNSGERRGVYRTGSDNPVFDSNKKSAISVEDLAVAIVDELENSKYIRQRFTVAY